MKGQGSIDGKTLSEYPNTDTLGANKKLHFITLAAAYEKLH
jgi:hypothetical protein